MRLTRLALPRYGHFTDAVIDFGPRPEAGPDLHILYGPNEAGKSTIFTAWLDLLYGIPNQTPMAFLHPYEALRIEAEIETGDSRLTLARIKRRTGDLLGPGDAPADPGVLSAALSGLGKEDLRAMFSLDDDTIEEGGDQILASKGELGALLFSAAAGYPALSRALEEVEARARAIVTPGGRGATELRALKAEIAELDRQRAEADTDAAAFARLAAEAEAAAEAATAARAEHDRLAAETARLETLAAGYPLHDALGQARAALAPLADLPSAPEGWAEELRRLSTDLAARREEARLAVEEATRAEAALAALPEDAEALALTGPLSALRTAKAESAREDLPRRRAEFAELDREAAALEVRIGLDPGAAVPDEPQLLALTHRASAVLSAAEATGRAAAEAMRVAEALAEAEADRARLTGPDGAPDAAPLAPMLRRLAPETLLSALARAREARAEAEAALAPALAALAPWAGDAAALMALPFPDPAAVEALRAEAEVLDTRRRDLTHARAKAEAAATRHRSRLQTLEAAGAPVSDVAAAALRAARDTAWETHRAALDPDTAEAFAAAMAADDALSERRIAESGRLAELRSAALALAEAEAEGAVIARDEAALAASAEDHRGRLAALLTRLGLPAETDAATLCRWLERAGQAVALAERAEAAARRLSSAEEGGKAAAETLSAALGHASTDLGALADLAAARAEAETRQQTLREAAQTALARQEREAKRRGDALAAAKEAAAAARADWAAVAHGTPFDGLEPQLAGDLVPLLRRLGGVRREAEGLAERIAAMEADSADFADRMAALTGTVAEDPLATHAALSERAAKAEQAAARRRDLDHGRAAAETRAAQARTAAMALTRRLGEMARGLGLGDTLPGTDETTLDAAGGLADRLALRLEDCARRARLAAECKTAETALVQRLGVADLTAAEAVLATSDPEAVAARLATLGPERRAAEAALEAAFVARGEAGRALAEIGADDGALRLAEARQGALTRLADRAEEAARLHLGALAARRALGRYRDRHRSEMLAHTAEAFRAITNGAFGDLSTRPDGAAERLVALRADGSSIGADAMSKGTRFQLYLALRVAGHRRFAEIAAPPPFFADDILETFDDRRAAAALGLLGEIGQRGQAICLTHHAHLCAIAREVYGEAVRIHEIPQPGRAVG